MRLVDDVLPQIRLLGPITVLTGRAVHPVPGLRRKAVLAALALHAGQMVSTGLLTEVVWSGRPPATAANTLQSHISYLRGIFGTKDSIVMVSSGYQLQQERVTTDLSRVEELIARARQLRNPADVACRLRQALRTWSDDALTGLNELPWFDHQAVRIGRVRASAIKTLVQARLDLGEHAVLVPELQDLVANHPFDEDIHAHLMLALYRAGRQADALDAYHNLRRCLHDELGIDPGPQIRKLQTAILRHDPVLSKRTTASRKQGEIA